MKLNEINPYVRYVNNYSPAYSYIENERVIYDYEFMYIMSGSAVMNYDGRKYQLNKGDLLCLKPMVKNSITVEAENKLRTHCIHFDYYTQDEKYNFTAEEFYMHSVLSENHKEKELILQTRPTPLPSDFNLPTHCTNLPYELFAPLFEKCYREFSINSTSSLLKAKAILTEIIAELSQSISTNAHTEAFHPKILHAIEYIKDNYSSHITVAELAKKYELSPKYFGKLFYATTGKNVNAFILEKRIFAAKEMLIGTDMTINEISLATGFNDSFYFSKCFKIVENLSPLHYRNLMRNGN